jgi:aspartate racemase
MKTIGLIGGTSWISTIDYYTNINQQINELLGGLNSAKILLYSLNFEEFKPPVELKDWFQPSTMLPDIAKKLERAGADCIVLCANTPHIAAHIIQQNIKIPLIHIAEAAANEIMHHHIKKVAFLGTKITMEENFFKDKLLERQIEVLIPALDDRQFMHDAVFNEMGKGIFTFETKKRFISITNDLIEQGAKGVILGCTEFPHLIKPEDCAVPTFDTTVMHVNAAVKFALGA